VLPSRFDGWGAVVNEALMVGTPVICSNRCGASDVIENGRNGYVFEAGSARALRERLRQYCEEFRWNRTELAHTETARLSGPAVAARFQHRLAQLLAPQQTPPQPAVPGTATPMVKR
jgi:glycosyltransferase involved in cell wall biosynthesis